MLKRLIALQAFIFILFFSSPGFCETNILNIRHWAAPDHTRIVIDTSEDADIKITKNPQVITIDFSNAIINEDVPIEKIINKKGIRAIQVKSMPENNVSVSLMLSDGAQASIFKLGEVQEKPFRIVVDLNFPEIEKKESEERQKFKVTQKDKIIVIDPGHGGEDPGAMGPNKSMEKDVVLSIAKKLEWLLNHKKGYRAFLTRDGDYYPSFKKRLQIAKEYGADLFISIHADAARSKQPKGCSVYVLSTTGASSAAARLLARQENLADIVGGSDHDQSNDETDPITLNMIQTETINMSKALANTVLTRFQKFSTPKFPCVQEAQFIVLKLPHVPSILVETGYISNPKEEKLLTSNGYQNRIALALCLSIQNFLRDPEPDDDALQIAMEEDKESNESAKEDDKKDSAEVESGPPRKAPESKPVPRMILYRVKKGESLKTIARKFETSQKELMTLNHLSKSGPIQKKFIKVYLPVKEAGKSSNSENDKDNQPKVEKSVPQKDKPVFYIVKKGDSLARIAQKYNTTSNSLADTNNIKPSGPLYIGKKLVIPDKETHSGDKPEKKNSIKSPSASEKCTVHLVKRGDSMEKIAKKYDVPLNVLLKTNHMKLKDSLCAGRKITISDKSGVHP